jgi:hypothetical protein
VQFSRQNTIVLQVYDPIMPNTYKSHKLAWSHPFLKIQAVLSQMFIQATILANRIFKLKIVILIEKIFLVPSNVFLYTFFGTCGFKVRVFLLETCTSQSQN